MAKSQETKEQFMALRSRGMSYDRISGIIHVSKNTLIKWNRELSSQIEQLQGDELEALLEEFRIARQHRIARFVEQIDRIELQLENRELDDVQTDRLLRIWVRMMEAVRMEIDTQLRVGVTVEESPLDRWERIVSQIVEPVAEVASKALPG